MNSIYVSIPSLMDLELLPTIKDMLEKADHPENITVSVFVQDEKPNRDKILKIVQTHNAKLKYAFIEASETLGVGYARQQAMAHLVPGKHKYFLQLDSHMRFIDGWDSEIISDYENLIEVWGDYIYSVYPNNYGYEDGALVLESVNVNSMQAKVDKPSSASRYGGKIIGHSNNPQGEETGYLCAGFAFGLSKFFFNNQPHISLFHNEESFLSIMFHKNKVKIVAPHKNYVYHDYNGGLEDRRLSFFVDQKKIKLNKYKKAVPIESMVKKLEKFYENFYLGKVDGIEIENLIDDIESWKTNYVQDLVDDL